MKRTISITIGLMVAGLLGSPLVAQEAEGEARTFVDTMDVNIVSFEVYVTDKQGEVVTDLEKGDFEVFENGRQMEISNFEVVDDRAVVKRDRNIRVDEQGEVITDRSVSPEGVRTDNRLYMIVFVDNLNIAPFNRNRVFTRLRQFLSENTRADDRVMLVSYNRSLNVRVPFTSDPLRINSALFEMEDETGQAVHRNAERSRQLKAIEDSETYADALFYARSFAEEQYNDVQFTVDGLRELVEMVSGLRGRKAVVHVSDGIPMVAAEDLFYAVNEKFHESSVFTQARDFDSTRNFVQLVSYANSSRVTFYTIDAAGLRTNTSASVEQAHAGLSSFVDSANIQNLQAPIVRMAHDTGGTVIMNSNDVKDGLDRLSTDLRTFYSLAYHANHYGDGRYHRIEVKVKKKGLRVRHRIGYRDISLTQKMTLGTMATLRFGENDNPMGLQLKFGQATERTDGNYVVPLMVGIPLSSITLIPQAGNYEANLRLFVSAMDADGGTSAVQEVNVPIQVPEAEIQIAKERGWLYEMPLLMRPGDHFVAIGARDYWAGVESFISKPVGVAN